MQMSMMHSVLTKKEEIVNLRSFEEVMKAKFIAFYNLTDLVEK